MNQRIKRQEISSSREELKGSREFGFAEAFKKALS